MTDRKEITESDWKKFKKIKDKALDKFCAAALSDFDNVISGKGASNYDRYISIYKGVQKHDKKLAQLFDGLSRSKAYLQLMLMRSEGLVEEDDLLNLSEHMQEFTKPVR